MGLSHCNEAAEGECVSFPKDSYAIQNKMTIVNGNPAYFNQSVWSKVQLYFRC